MGNLVQSFINYFGLIIKFGEETHPLAKLLKTIFDHGFIAQKGRSTSKLRLEGLFIHIENKPHSDNRGSENMDCSHSAMYHQKAEPQDVEGSHMSTVSRRMSTLR